MPEHTCTLKAHLATSNSALVLRLLPEQYFNIFLENKEYYCPAPEGSNYGVSITVPSLSFDYIFDEANPCN